MCPMDLACSREGFYLSLLMAVTGYCFLHVRAIASVQHRGLRSSMSKIPREGGLLTWVGTQLSKSSKQCASGVQRATHISRALVLGPNFNSVFPTANRKYMSTAKKEQIDLTQLR